MTAITLNFLGKILCCPPIVNSPKGKPQATRTVIVDISPNNAAPNIENINQYPPSQNTQNFSYNFLFLSQQICSPTCKLDLFLCFLTSSY